MKHFASTLVAAVATAAYKDMNISVNGDSTVFKFQPKDWSSAEVSGN